MSSASKPPGAPSDESAPASDAASSAAGGAGTEGWVPSSWGVEVTHARVEALARSTLASGLIQLATHFPSELGEVELTLDEAVEQAWRLAEEALELAPDLPDAYVVLARLVLVHESDEALGDAFELLERALALERDHDAADLAVATARWRQGDQAGALEGVGKVLARGNMLPQPLVLRGLLHLEAGRSQEARRDLERAVALAPASGLVRLDAAEAAEAAGDGEAAASHRARARELLGEAFETWSAFVRR